MIVRWGALRRAEGLNAEEFEREWLERHVPLVQYAPGLRSYRQNVVVDSEQRSPFPRGRSEFDGFAQLGFDSLNGMRATMSGVRADPRVDISHFAHEPLTIACVRKFDRRPPEGRALVKRISLLKRAPGVSPETFQHEWWGEHSRLVADLPGYAGYAQNLVIEAIGGLGETEIEDPPFDGIVEFWFESPDAMRECYGSEEFARVAAHGEEFIGEITTYLVAEHVAETAATAEALGA